ncbi:MAG: DNA cytosine methyltransferase [Romboutsia sp.]
MKLKGMSLFANVGIAENLLHECGVDVVLANELIVKRAEFYRHIFPNSEMVQGDITDENIFNIMLSKAIEYNVDFIIATPPCQGMSTAGKQDKSDVRNQLISYAIDMIKQVKPKYVMLENVPQQLKTKIRVNDKEMLIPDYIKSELSELYNFNKNQVMNTADYGVAQSRERSIFLLARKDLEIIWEAPEKNDSIVTLYDAIGHLPKLDPLIYDIPYEEHLKVFPLYEERLERAMKISKWYIPPEHVYRQVYAMIHTPSGQSAFSNENIKHKPTTEKGTLVKGFKNTYKRQSWDKPAYTVTMYNRTIGSQENVHPGRPTGIIDEGVMTYSDARVLTVYELMIVMSIPLNWNIPDWATEHFVRQVIGEGIPPLLVKKLFQQIV